MAINLDVHGNTSPLEAQVQAAVNRIRKTPIRITIDDKGATQPLGNMKRGADEFTKSMEAANARILAFGASMAIINGVSDAFKGMVRNMVEVEKSLADINVVMGLSAKNLDAFSDGLFKVAKDTASSFKIAADAATEYARQGLSVEESLKRTKDALILTRLTGMDSAEAVKSLTAAMNTYGHQIKDTTQLVSKFAAVDVQFAVSAEDFADAISRTGAAAKGAGVDIDELIGIVTAAQQQTARGGKVIGNSLKTIFTRVGRTDTLNQLENLGIAVRDVEGKTLGAKRILTDLANTFDSLSEAQKAQIAQTVGGVFQINVLKAILGDAAKQNGILANATQISASATDEAIDKNKELNKTISALVSQTGTSIVEMSSKLGEITLGPGMEKILNAVKSMAEGINTMLGDGEGTGNKFATGLLKGIGNIITGPGLVVLTTVFFKLFGQAFKFTRDSLSSLIGITTEAQKQKAIQTSLVSLFGQNAALSKEMLRTDISRTEKEKMILGLLKAQVAEANALNAISKQAAATLYTKGYGANLAPMKRRGRAEGHIPNFAHPEREQAARGGYAAGNIRSMNMPGEGSIIYNSAEKVKNFKGMTQPAIMPPQSSKAGKNYQQAFGDIHGFDPYAARGYIPNFALKMPFKRSKYSEKTEDLTIEEAFARGNIHGNTIKAAFGDEAYKKALKKGKTTVGRSSDLQKINLNNLFPEISEMGVLLGFGSTDSVGPVEYKQKHSTLSKPAKDALNKRLSPSLVKKLNKKGAHSPLVSATLQTKPVYEVTEGDVNLMEKVLGESILEKKLYKHVGRSFDKFSHEIGVDMFGGKVGKAGVGVLKTHMDGSMLGGMLEAGVRGSLTNKKVSDSQAPFDFVGEDAKNVAKFIGDEKLRYIESKLHKSAAAGSSGKLPMKILNQIKATGFIPNFAAMAISRLGGLGKSKFGLAAVINSNPYFSQLLKRYGHWKNFPSQEKTKLNKFLLKQGFTNRTLQGYGLASMHGKSIGEGISNVAAAGGYVPNFANPLSDAIGREKAAGVPVSQIRVGSHPALMNKGNPIGLGVTNTQDEPNGLRDVFGAANGFVPNYAEAGFQRSDVNISGRNLSAQDKLVQELNRKLKVYIDKFKKGSMNQQQLNNAIAGLSQKTKNQSTSSERVTRKTNESIGYISRLNASRKRASTALSGAYSSVRGGISGLNTKFGNTALGKGLGSTGGQMGLMMGAPMLAGMLQGEGPGKVSDTQYQAGGALMGVGTGAAMGMMFGPLGAAIGGVIGGFSGLLSASEDLKEAQEKAAKAERESSIQTGAALAQSLAPSLAKTNFGKGGLVEFSFGGEQRKIDLDNFNKLSAKDPSKAGGFGMRMGENIRSQMLGSIDLDVKGIFKKVGRSDVTGDKTSSLEKWGVDAPELGEIQDLLKQSGANLSRQQVYESMFTGEKLNGYSEMFSEKESAKKIEDQILAQMGSAARPEAIKAALDQLPKDMKIQTAALKEGSTAGGRAFKKGDLEYFTPEELKKQIDEGNITQVAKAYADIVKQVEVQRDLNVKQNEAIILQLNAQRAIVTAQQQARDMQFDIKSSYAKIGSSLSLQAKIMGNFATEQQKAQLDYTKAINKAAESYAAGTLSERDKYRQGMLTFSKDDNIASALKTSLAKKQLLEEKGVKSGSVGASFLESSNDFKDKIKAKVEEIELTDELIKLSNEELYAELKKANLNTTQLQALEDYKNSKEKNIEMLLKELNLSSKIAQNEFKINDAIAKRKDLLANMSGAIGMSDKQLAHDQKMRGFASQLAAAQRLTAVGPGYQTRAQQEDFQMREKRIAIEETATTLRGNATSAINKKIKERTDLELQQQLTKEQIGTSLDPFEQNELQQTLIKQQQTLAFINHEIKNINESTEEEISNAKKLLAEEEKRLAAKRAHQTGPGAFGRGMSDSMAQMRDEVQYMNYELGQNIPRNFADGLASAMTDALNGAKDLDDALTDAAINFLGAIQQALMQQAAYSIVGGLGFNMNPRSRGGNIRNYSRGGGVPAMVTNGEYVMGRDAVNKYGGAFMHSLNAGGKIPGFSNGGAVPGSAVSAGFGGGKHVVSERAYQSKPMSGYFYSGQAGSVALQEDESALMGVLAAEEKKRQEALAKKAKRRALLQQVIGTVASVGINYAMQGINLGGAGADSTPLSGDQGGGATITPVSEGGSGVMRHALDLDDATLARFNMSGLSGRLKGPRRFGVNNNYLGGKINKYASGGHISGKSGIDQIPAMLSEGEYVIRASSARQLGKPMLDMINAGKFNEGGPVTPMQESSDSGISGGNTNNINISINMERGKSSEEKSSDSDVGTNPAEKSEEQQNSSQLAERIKAQVVSVIVEEQRPGGLLSGKS